MKQLRFICAQPANTYYAWQVEVLLNNFIEMGVDLAFVDIIAMIENGVVPEAWSKLAKAYSARFFFYPDKRLKKNYISSVRPNILKQHFFNHPYLKNDAIFYHDCDIIFTKPISEWITDEMINDENWYGSDTRWYICHSYIKSKGDEVLQKMCEIMKMDASVIEANELNSIGAQYLMKNVDARFWDRVEYDCERLFKEITDLNTELVQINRHTVNPGEPAKASYNPLQIWCADMWAVLWGAWRLNYKTICHKNFEFSWGTSSIGDYERMNIMHNAGVTSSTEGYFYKALYMTEYPYNKELNIREGTGSRKYWEYVQKVAKKSCLL